MTNQTTFQQDLTPYIERDGYRTPPKTNPPAYLKDLEACERYGVSRSTWWRWLAEGVIPSPVKIGPRATRWKLSDLMQWEQQRSEAGQ